MMISKLDYYFLLWTRCVARVHLKGCDSYVR